MPKTRSNKNKGKKGQNEIRDMILERFPELDQRDVLSTTMGDTGVDIKLSPAALKLFPFNTEVKRRRDFATLYNYYNQADQGDQYEPIVFLRRDRGKWLVVLDARYFLDHYENMESGDTV